MTIAVLINDILKVVAYMKLLLCVLGLDVRVERGPQEGALLGGFHGDGAISSTL